MATTLTSGTELLTLTKTYTQNGEEKNVALTHTMNAVLYDDMRTMAVPMSAEITLIDLAAIGTAIGPGKFNQEKVLYLIIKNCDDTNFVRVGFKSATDTVYFKVRTGQLLVFPAAIDIDTNITGAAFSAYVPSTTIVVQADTAACDIMYNIFQST